MSVSLLLQQKIAEKIQYAPIQLEVTTVIVKEGSHQIKISHNWMELNAKVKRA